MSVSLLKLLRDSGDNNGRWGQWGTRDIRRGNNDASCRKVSRTFQRSGMGKHGNTLKRERTTFRDNYRDDVNADKPAIFFPLGELSNIATGLFCVREKSGSDVTKGALFGGKGRREKFDR